jgi:hypothetical protein
VATNSAPAPYRWLEHTISFSRANQWLNFDHPSKYPLLVDPVIHESRVNKVLVDGGSNINVTFPRTLQAPGVSIADLTQSYTPFFGIVPTEGEYPVGGIRLLKVLKKHDLTMFPKCNIYTGTFELGIKLYTTWKAWSRRRLTQLRSYAQGSFGSATGKGTDLKGKRPSYVSYASSFITINYNDEGTYFMTFVRRTLYLKGN